MRSASTFCSVSTSTTPRSTSRPTLAEPSRSSSAFLASSSLVVSATCFCSSAAFCCRYRLIAMTIWFFHSGMVVRMELWDLLDEVLVVALDEADLRGGLDGDHARELEVVQTALEPGGGLLEVGEALGGHDIAAGRHLRSSSAGIFSERRMCNACSPAAM